MILSEVNGATRIREQSHVDEESRATNVREQELTSSVIGASFVRHSSGPLRGSQGGCVAGQEESFGQFDAKRADTAPHPSSASLEGCVDCLISTVLETDP